MEREIGFYLRELWRGREQKEQRERGRGRGEGRGGKRGRREGLSPEREEKEGRGGKRGGREGLSPQEGKSVPPIHKPWRGEEGGEGREFPRKSVPPIHKPWGHGLWLDPIQLRTHHPYYKVL